MPSDPKAPDPSVNSLFTAITPGYCEALGIKLLRGRDFTQNECENKDARRVAIIDEEMVKKLFPNEDPIGQHIRYTNPPKDGSPNDMEVVGVVSKHRHSVDNDSLVCRLFVPLAQGYTGQTYLHVRLNTQDPHAVAAFIPTLRQTLREVDPDLPLLWTDIREAKLPGKFPAAASPNAGPVKRSEFVSRLLSGDSL